MKRILLLIYNILLLCVAHAQQPIEVAVICVNDFHGALVRDDFRGIPGAAAVVETIDSLRRVYPASVVVSAGDNFGGSYFYQTTRSESLLPLFFADCGIHISGVGNHEFDEGQDKLLHCWRDIKRNLPAPDWHLQYVGANIRCDASSPMRKGNTSQPQFCNPHATEKLTLPDGRTFVVNFVGLTTSSTPRQASASKLKGLSFDGRIQQVLDSLPESMWEHANANILLCHQGTTMKQVRRGCIIFNEPVWDDADSLALSQLSDPRVNAILSSHSHKPVVGYINDHRYAITQGASQGRYLAMLKLLVDSTSLEVQEVQPELIQVTPKSYYSEKATLLQTLVDQQLQNTRTKGGAALGDYLTTASKAIPFDRALMKHDQTYMGQLVTRAYSHALRQTEGFDEESLIVGVTHIGGMRTGLQAGPIRVMDVGEVLPFDNQMRAFRVTGKQLRALIEYGLHNERYGYLQFAHLTPKMSKTGHVKRLTYVTSTGKHIKIKESSTCYIVADEFISNGGDGYEPALFPAKQEIHGLTLPRITDAFINYLRLQKTI